MATSNTSNIQLVHQRFSSEKCVDPLNAANIFKCPSEMISIRFASSRIVSLQPDTDIQKLLSNGNRIRISETVLSIFRGFRLFEKVAHCTIIVAMTMAQSYSFIIFRSIFSAFCAMTPSLSVV